MPLLDVAPPPRSRLDRRAWMGPSHPWDKAEMMIAFLTGTSGLDDKDEAGLADMIKNIAEEWTQGTGLRFTWIEDPASAEVRIALQTEGCWSYVGVPPVLAYHQPTMNIDGGLYTMTEQFRHCVLHEFGHMLNLMHEHQVPGLQPDWNVEAIKQDPRIIAAQWDDDQINNNILAHAAVVKVGRPDPDPDSVMLYPFPASWTTNGVAGKLNAELSRRDLEDVRTIYGNLISRR